MRSEIWKDPTAGLIRQFATQNLADVRYVIANKTPFLVYVTDQAVLSVDAAQAAQITSVDPMATKIVGAINANNLTIAVAGNIRVAFGSNTGTFVAVTTVASNESITDIESSSAWANYNASAEDELLATTPTIALLPGSGNQQVFGPHDISQWTGFYFAWSARTSNLTSFPAFPIVSVEFSTDGVSFNQSRMCEGRAGYIAHPKIAKWFLIRFTGVNSVQGDAGSYTYTVSLRRVSTPLDPVVSLLEDTVPFVITNTLPAATTRLYFLPNNGGRNRAGVSVTNQAVPTHFKIAPFGGVYTDEIVVPRDSVMITAEYDGDSTQFNTTTIEAQSGANIKIVTLYYWAVARVDV